MQIGEVVKATAGKEKENIFVVVSAQDNFVYIANGKRLSILKPKKKNVKHIQKVSSERLNLSESDLKLKSTDAMVRKFLKTQKERICQKKM